ncbi:hypothetical protein [Prosthecobacter sp.]|uniref:hypothetical protein n=1 Tax=Prosthecobacter sp. TaxID=1965333 RepID=UPI002486F15A|nr:hypothetical protein [Prosthecobacter sp.]MDI1311543.1 hypothetical protein [Prosthecobacter sp.]
MNRIFGITGFLATGTTIFWGCCVIGLPWLLNYSSHSPIMPLWAWILWGSMGAIGLVIIFAFLRCSLRHHWMALRHDSRMPPIAWRGVCGVYFLLMLALALPVLAGDPSGTHQAEVYLYIGLVGCCLALGALAVRRGFFPDSSRPELPLGWYYPDADDAQRLIAEFQRELTRGHLLDGVPVEAFAWREGATDDVLFHHRNQPGRFTVIHLSWLGSTEINAQHPTVEFDGTFAEFLADDERIMNFLRNEAKTRNA